MNLFRRKNRQEKIPVTHIYSELDRITSNYDVPGFIIDNLKHAESDDRRLLRAIKGLKSDDADLRAYEIKALYKLAEVDGMKQHAINQIVLNGLHSTNKAAEIEIKKCIELTDEDYKQLKKEYLKYEGIHSGKMNDISNKTDLHFSNEDGKEAANESKNVESY